MKPTKRPLLNHFHPPKGVQLPPLFSATVVTSVARVALHEALPPYSTSSFFFAVPLLLLPPFVAPRGFFVVAFFGWRFCSTLSTVSRKLLLREPGAGAGVFAAFFSALSLSTSFIAAFAAAALALAACSASAFTAACAAALVFFSVALAPCSFAFAFAAFFLVFFSAALARVRDLVRADLRVQRRRRVVCD